MLWVLKYPRNNIFQQNRHWEFRGKTSASYFRFCSTEIEQYFPSADTVPRALNTPTIHVWPAWAPRRTAGGVDSAHTEPNWIYVKGKGAWKEGKNERQGKLRKRTEIKGRKHLLPQINFNLRPCTKCYETVLLRNCFKRLNLWHVCCIFVFCYFMSSDDVTLHEHQSSLPVAVLHVSAAACVDERRVLFSVFVYWQTCIWSQMRVQQLIITKTAA